MDDQGNEWALAAVHDVVASAVPDRTMVVCGAVRRTHAEVRDRSRALAAFFVDRGVGLDRERGDLERWECGQAAVALVMQNRAEYLESMFGAYRARAVPFNVNQHYAPGEVGALLEYLSTRAVVYQRSFGPLLAEAVDVADLVLVDIDDGSGIAPLPGSTGYDEIVARTEIDVDLPEPSADDLYVVCTGGTTGRPKAVLWRQGDIYVSAMNGGADATAATIAAGAADGEGTWYPVPPLMHAAAQWTAFCGLLSGGTVALHDDTGPFDAATILDVVEQERAIQMSIVGDAYARPLVDELRRGGRDVSSLLIIGTGGAVTSVHHKEALLELIPGVTIVDGYGASETGGMAFGATSATHRAESFFPGAGATVVSEDLDRFLEPGDDELGWTARQGRVPLGYLGDRAKTEATFPIIGGQRVAVPGDRARLLADGSIEMLGRDSMVINTGGEKVFVEEVELVLRSHPDVADAVVVGRPSERFGQEVVAVVAPLGGTTIDSASLRGFVAGEIARFKAPRAVVLCDVVRRHANGKPDYAWARETALAAVDVVAG